MRNLVLKSSAIADFNDIAQFVAEQSTSRALADALIDRLTAQCERLADLPGTLGTDRSELTPGLRSTPHRGYVIFFRYTDDAVEIINILHASRDVIAYFTDDAGGD